MQASFVEIESLRNSQNTTKNNSAIPQTTFCCNILHSGTGIHWLSTHSDGSVHQVLKTKFLAATAAVTVMKFFKIWPHFRAGELV